mmetsp:Transcript_7423/g.17958  ORF Transcript_7423/g.17958 Transcript_7423/m.17958 type:complete len:715 (+) Transcript_7423:3-2147(+)
MYMDVWPATQNNAAKDAAKALGREYSCDDPELAVPECFVAENWNTGWVGELAHNIVTSLQLNITAMTRANFSEAGRAAYEGASSYTRCVWEVRVGHVDLCVGDFWETEPRREIAAFTSAMDSDMLKLGTLSVGLDDDFKASNLLKIFDPFDSYVWLVNVVMVLVSAFLIWLVEEGTPFNSDYFCQLDPEAHLNKGQGLGKSVWLGLMAYVSGGAAHQGTTWPGRLIILGFGFFIYISVSSYTANLASFMMTAPAEVGLISLYSDIIKKGGALCVLEAIEDMVETPGLTLETFDDYLPAIEGMYNRRCLGTIVGRNEWRLMVTGGIGSGTVCVDPADTKGHSTCEDPDGETRPVKIGGCRCTDLSLNPSECPKDCPDHLKYCSMLEVLDPDFQYYMNFALPVSNHLEQYFSAWILYARQGGVTMRLRQKYIEQVSPNMCGDEEGSSGVDESQSLDIKSMAGTFVISGTFMLAGVIWFCTEKYLKYREAQLAAEGGDEQVDSETGEKLKKIHSPSPASPRMVSPGRAPHMRGAAEGKFGQRNDTLAAAASATAQQNGQYTELAEKISKQQRMLQKQEKQLAQMMTLLTEMSNRQAAKEIEASSKPALPLLEKLSSMGNGFTEGATSLVSNARRGSALLPSSLVSTPANGTANGARDRGDKEKATPGGGASRGPSSTVAKTPKRGSDTLVSANPLNDLLGSISSNILGSRDDMRESV